MISGTVYDGTMPARSRIPPNSLLGASKQQLRSRTRFAPQNSSDILRQRPVEHLQKSACNCSVFVRAQRERRLPRRSLLLRRRRALPHRPYALELRLGKPVLSETRLFAIANPSKG